VLIAVANDKGYSLNLLGIINITVVATHAWTQSRLGWGGPQTVNKRIFQSSPS
jgi:hypothetical protein